MSTFSSGNVTDGNLLQKECTNTIDNKIQLHILGVPLNKLGNWLIASCTMITNNDDLQQKQSYNLRAGMLTSASE